MTTQHLSPALFVWPARDGGSRRERGCSEGGLVGVFESDCFRLLSARGAETAFTGSDSWCRAHQWSNVYPTHFTRSSKPCSGPRHKNNFMGFPIKTMFLPYINAPLVLCSHEGWWVLHLYSYFCHHASLTMGHMNCAFLFTFSRNWHTIFKIYEIIFNWLIDFELILNWLILNQVIPCFCSFRLY